MKIFFFDNFKFPVLIGFFFSYKQLNSEERRPFQLKPWDVSLKEVQKPNSWTIWTRVWAFFFSQLKQLSKSLLPAKSKMGIFPLLPFPGPLHREFSSWPIEWWANGMEPQLQEQLEPLWNPLDSWFWLWLQDFVLPLSHHHHGPSAGTSKAQGSLGTLNTQLSFYCSLQKHLG